ncbi:MAG: hypothetical protein ACRDEA_22425, partial [Microcystaceae cyanobacterium]
MPSKLDLQTYLGVEEGQLNEYLSACWLPDQQNYTDSERDLVEKYRDGVVQGGEGTLEQYQTWLRSGQTPQSALEQLVLLAQSQQSTAEEEGFSQGKGKTARRGKKKTPVSLLDLLKEGQKLTSKPMTLSRGLELLQACGLSEKTEYTPDESSKFLRTCDQVINQGQSLGEVARQNEVQPGATTFKRVERVAGENVTTFEEELVSSTTDLDERIAQTYRHAYLSRLEEIFVSGEFEQACQEAR